MAPYLETLAGYPVETAGWSMAPRGLGTAIGMLAGQHAVQQGGSIARSWRRGC